jgi:hypothetical protein
MQLSNTFITSICDQCNVTHQWLIMLQSPVHVHVQPCTCSCACIMLSFMHINQHALSMPRHAMLMRSCRCTADVIWARALTECDSGPVSSECDNQTPNWCLNLCTPFGCVPKVLCQRPVSYRHKADPMTHTSSAVPSWHKAQKVDSEKLLYQSTH